MHSIDVIELISPLAGQSVQVAGRSGLVSGWGKLRDGGDWSPQLRKVNAQSFYIYSSHPTDESKSKTDESWKLKHVSLFNLNCNCAHKG